LNSLLKTLKLEKIADTIIGRNLRKGISGGEKKRLNIGFELLSDPKILFLDEPTSGLDSYTSFVIVKLLRRLAREKNLLIVYTHSSTFHRHLWIIR
jgi:ATP-binding cassette subfamily G (WHITE) protein 2